MKFKPTKSMSAAELMGRLQSDSDWVRENAEREARHKAAVEQRREELRPEQTPLLAELAAAGIKVDSVWNLVNAKRPYPAAVPILAAHLQRVRHPVLREGIGRALTVPEARGAAARIILSELQRPFSESPHSVRWVLANALTLAGDESMVNEIRALIADDQYTDVRERLATALEKIGSRLGDKGTD
jgi:hypothetical protein